MNLRETKRLAKQKYGPTASAGNFSSKDRNQRFGIMFYVPGGAFNAPVVGCLGHGDSYESAWEHAQKNPIAEKLAEDWTKLKEVDYKEFGEDPIAYKKKHEQAILAAVEKLEKLEKLEKENNNG